MYEIEADPQANRLYLSFTGRLDRAEMETAADETVETAERLRDGFDIVNDLAGFTPPSPEAAKPIKRAQAELKEMGVDRVVRVTDEETSQVVVNAFERRSRDVGYSGETADSVAEAERKLDETEVAGYASA
ncbi:hypothetical protein [Halosimplex halobium]|uniref:hypothetical protein n=1 Tax=Halosimplex halobium TaxID=3396618 RepID=UPI003F57342B